MKETETHTGRQLHRHRRGFISAYFLAMFLFLSMYAAIVAENVRNRSLTVLNLKREQEYYIAEFPEIRDVMCQLQQEKSRREAAEKEREETEQENEEDSSEAVQEPEESILADGDTVLLQISGPLPEEVILTVDPKTMKVIDYTPLRNEENSDP